MVLTSKTEMHMRESDEKMLKSVSMNAALHLTLQVG